MRCIQKSKRLVGFAIALGSVAVVTGCSSSSSSKSSEPSLYSSPSYSATATPSQGKWYASGGTGGASASTQASTSTQTPMSQGEISIPLYEEQLAVGTRTVESGSVRLRKQVTTETVNQPVQIRRETLVVEREAGARVGEAAKDGSGTFTPFEQNEIVIKLHTEEPVIEKRVVSTGRIVAKTSTNAEQVTVQREVRKENIDVEKIGNPQNVTISENVTVRSSDAIGGTGTASQQATGTSKGQDQGSDKRPAEQKTDYREKPVDNGTAPDGKGTLK